MPVINHESRVYHTWVNGNEHFYYHGGTKELNDILQKFAALSVDVREVVLRPGPETVMTFNKEYQIAYNCLLHIQGGISRHEEEGTNVFDKYPTMTVFVDDSNIALEQIKIPADFTLIELADLRGRYLKGLYSTDKSVRGYAAFFLAGVDFYSGSNVFAIAKLLEDEDMWVRLMAAGALARFGRKAEPILPTLKKGLKDGNERIRNRFRETIEKIETAKDTTEAEQKHNRLLKKIFQFLKSRNREKSESNSELSEKNSRGVNVEADVEILPKELAGTLRDDAGNPIAYTKIIATNTSGFHCGMVKVKKVETMTDQHGRFSLQTGFLPVYLRVESNTGVMCYPGNPYYNRIPLPLLRQHEHEIVLMRTARISGKVVDDKTGKPIKEFAVHFQTSMTHAPRRYKSEDGRFEENRIIPGAVNLSFMAAGYAPKIIHAIAVSPGSTNYVGEVRVTTGPTLRGRILDKKSGQPLSGALVRFRDMRTHAATSYPPHELTATTDVKGRFSVSNMPLLTLELYTSLEKPELHTVTIGNVDMSLARNGVLTALFFVDTGIKQKPNQR